MTADIEQTLQTAIDDLAVSPDPVGSEDIADRLLQDNCHGKPDSPCYCPLAVWFTMRLRQAGVLPADWVVAVLLDGVEVRDEFEETQVWRRLAPVLSSFVVAFDDLYYPDLITTETWLWQT